MTSRRYVIMANGQGRRWGNHGGIPKHLIEIDGESLLARTVRLAKAFDPDAEIIISSSDPRYEVEGAIRHAPARAACEIDRFTRELICDGICFLYGDTYYTERAMRRIVEERVEDMKFFGNRKTVFAVRASDGDAMKSRVEKVRELHLSGSLEICKGWQLYQCYAGLPMGEPCIGRDFVLLEDETKDFNSPRDLDDYLKEPTCS